MSGIIYLTQGGEIMAQKYSNEFKEEACKRVMAGEIAAQVARELGINENTLYTWKSKYKEYPAEPFVGSGNLHQEDARLRTLKKRVRDLEEENEFLKKASAFFAKNLK
jgi:transposase